jgi:SAM-dependent methyltransferase
LDLAVSLYTTIRNSPIGWLVASKARYLPGLFWLWKKGWFRTSVSHWQRHYERGGDSGPGSYGDSASYKADLINRVIRKYGIRSIIELGCGDGNQLAYLEVDEYVGLDISKSAIQRCLARHGGNTRRSFIWYDQDHFHDPLHVVSADCSMSLDVIFHLVEDDVFSRYVRNLFNCGRRFVIIYALDMEQEKPVHVSVLLRKYSDYIATAIPEFRIALHVTAKHTFGDFYLYERISNASSNCPEK